MLQYYNQRKVWNVILGDTKLKRTKHIQPKKEDTSKEQKENVHYFQKKDKKCKKTKEDKNRRRKGKFAFPCHANQIGIEGEKNTFIIRAVIIT